MGVFPNKDVNEVGGQDIPLMFIMDRHGRYVAYDNGNKAPALLNIEGAIGKRFRDVVENEDAIRRREAAIGYILGRNGGKREPWVQYDDAIHFKSGVFITQTTLVTANTEDTCAVYAFEVKAQCIGNVIPFPKRKSQCRARAL